MEGVEPLAGLSDQDLDRILSGDAPAGDASSQALTAFAREARAAYVAPVPEVIRALHLAAILDAATKAAVSGNGAGAAGGSSGSGWATGTAPAVAARRPRRRRGLTVAAVAAAAVVSLGGLASAGVLPDPVQRVASEVLGTLGISVPDGDEDGFAPAPLEEGSTAAEHASETARAVLGVIDGWLPGAKGCEFGHAVAEAAGGNPGPCRSQAGGKGKAAAERKGGKELGQARAAEAREKAEERRAGRAGGPSEEGEPSGEGPGGPPAEPPGTAKGGSS